MAPPLAPPRDLTVPEPGSRTAREVLSHAIRRLLAELAALAKQPTRLGLGVADRAAFASMVSDAIATSPGALASAARRPTVGALLRCLRSDVSVASELLATLAVELGAVDALARPVRVERLPARVLSLAAGLALTIPAAATELRVSNGEVTLVCDGQDITLSLRSGEAHPLIERPYARIAGDIVLATADNNPLRMHEAHPDKMGNAIDLGDHEIEQWRAPIKQALDLISTHLPDLRDEIDLFIHQFVPVGYDPERHLSASYQEAIGTIYLSLHPSLMTMTEAIVHEFSHNKINALFELDPVLVNAFSPLYASPVRPDPRPLHGVLLAIHAFFPVARLYEAMIEAKHPLVDAGFVRRYAAIRAINREGAEVVLSHGVPTPLGRSLLDELRRHDERFAQLA